MNYKKAFSSAFTLVELLIVIVVIAILAAISIVGYNGIQERARGAAVSSALSQASQKIAVWQVDNPGVTPSSLNDAGVSNTDTITYQYSQTNNNQDYCITATTGNTSYYLNSTTQRTPTSGGCPGHGTGGQQAITNLVVNPSVESNLDNVGYPNGATGTRQVASALFGSQGVRVVTPANNIDSGIQFGVSGSVSSGTSYTASASVRAVTAGNYRLSIQGAGSASGSGGTNTSIGAGQTVRLSTTWTPTNTGSIAFYVLRTGGQSGSHTFDVDGAMLVAGSSSTTFADGNSPNWVWNGTQNNSTSTGPAQ